MKSEQFTTTVDLDGITVYVEGTFTKGDPGRWTMANGDPGYPPDGDDVEFDWECNHDDYEYLLKEYHSDQKIYEAIENIILDNPDRLVG